MHYFGTALRVTLFGLRLRIRIDLDDVGEGEGDGEELIRPAGTRQHGYEPDRRVPHHLRSRGA